MSSISEKRRDAVSRCIEQYRLQHNPAVEQDLLDNQILPTRSTKKLAVLILTYKREATNDELKAVSDQPAGVVRELRKDGFVFQDDGKTPPNYQYRNDAGAVCRKIIDIGPPSLVPQGRVKDLLDKSVAAAVAGIEIYNKPDFKYREETFSILAVNAWELLLKAKIVAETGNLDSIIDSEKSAAPDTNPYSNPYTIGLEKAMDKLVSMQHLDLRCKANIKLLNEVRNNAVHFINRSASLSECVQGIGTATLRNYVTAINDWFGYTLSQFNFYLMPVSFFGAQDLQPAYKGPGEQYLKNLLDHVRQTEDQFPPDSEARYAVTLSVEINIAQSRSPDALEAKWSKSEDAIPMTVKEEDLFRGKYPLTFDDLVQRCRDRYTDFKQDKRFYDLKRALEDPSKHGDRYCRIRYLDPLKDQGAAKRLYSTEIFKVLDKNYSRKR